MYRNDKHNKTESDMSNYRTYNRKPSIQRRKIAQRNRIIVESVIGGVLFSISIFGLVFLAYGLSA